MNTPIDYSSRYSFGHFCCRVKQGKRLSEFLQKYTDSGTETTHLAGYNILVFKYVKISAGLPLLFIGTIRERSSKIIQTNETCKDYKECYLMSNIPRRNLASGCHLLKKLINFHGGQLDVTTNIYLKSCAYHPDSECCTFFHGNLSDPKSSEETLLYLHVI